MQRIIALIDGDCFFVSCERADDPDLCGKPVCVMTGNNDRGIIVSRSREAKNLGIKMGTPYFQIKGKYPSLICIPVHHKRYSEISATVMNIIREYTPDVEVVSVDEAYADLTGINKIHGTTYTNLITEIRTSILNRTKIPVSIGLASSKTLAKLASDKAKKTGGIFVIRPDNILPRIGETSIAEVCGIGTRTAKKLTEKRITSVNDYVAMDDAWIKKTFGITGINLKKELLGETVTAVNPIPEAPQSIQDTSAFPDFSTDVDFIHSTLAMHIHRASQKLRRWNGFCSVISLMLRTKDFSENHIETKLSVPTNSEKTLRNAAHQMLDTIFRTGVKYRASGITLSSLTFDKTVQYDFFAETEVEDDNLSHAIDILEARFGQGIIKTAK